MNNIINEGTNNANEPMGLYNHASVKLSNDYSANNQGGQEWNYNTNENQPMGNFGAMPQMPSVDEVMNQQQVQNNPQPQPQMPQQPAPNYNQPTPNGSAAPQVNPTMQQQPFADVEEPAEEEMPQMPSFDNVEENEEDFKMPSFENTKDVHRMTARFRRLIGAGDKL